jgi:hypothetical protein
MEETFADIQGTDFQSCLRVYKKFSEADAGYQPEGR